MSGAATDPWLAIFVGGNATRMGGRPKGLLPVDGEGTSIVARLRSLASALGLRVVLVGAAEPYRAAHPDLSVIEDLPAGVGPLGGLAGALRARSAGPVVALACDMPYISLPLLERLAREAPQACVLASRQSGGRWDPLCARYDAESVLPIVSSALAQGVRSFQELFTRLEVVELVLTREERGQLVDWDTPEDIAHGACGRRTDLP